MNNPFSLFQNLLISSDALNPNIFFDEKEIILSIYDSDITDTINRESGKIRKVIDNIFWNTDEANHKANLNKVINFNSMLFIKAESMLDESIRIMIKDTDIQIAVRNYNNIQCIYENLLGLHTYTFDLYLDQKGILEKDNNLKLKYPFLRIEQALRIREKCRLNIGKEDTILTINNSELEVNTKRMEPYEAILKMAPSLNNHAELINNNITTNTNYNRITWGGTPKEFVYTFSELVENKTISPESNSRKARVEILLKVFLITKENNEEIEANTIIAYFNKHSRGEVF